MNEKYSAPEKQDEPLWCRFCEDRFENMHFLKIVELVKAHDYFVNSRDGFVSMIANLESQLFQTRSKT